MAGSFQDWGDDRTGFPLSGQGTKPYGTWALLAANVVTWLVVEMSGGSEDPEVLLRFGAMFGPQIAAGEYWRLFTAMFLHIGWMHLLFNSLGLLIFGRMVERMYGSVGFLAIYFVAGLSGSVASYLLNPIAIAAGASGAIFGVMGALGAFFLARRNVLGEFGRQSLVGIAMIAALNLAIGFAMPGIDNWAHLGGLAMGFSVGFAFTPRYRYMAEAGQSSVVYRLVNSNSIARRFWVLPAVCAILVAGVLLGNFTAPQSPLTHIRSASRLLERQSYAEALEEVESAIVIEPRYGESFYLRARILWGMGDRSGAISDLGRALRLGLNDHQQREALVLLIQLESR